MTAPEGWYRDPFGVHEERWFSLATPTDLVRDAGVETQDVPPRPTWDGPLEEPAEPLILDEGADLLRADQTAQAAPYDTVEARDAALDAGATGGLGYS